MIKDLWLIGIGTGSQAHVTLEGVQAMRDAAVILVPEKGTGKDDLAELRYHLIRTIDTKAQVIPFDYPVRDPSLPYQQRVSDWHDEIARRWQDALDGRDISGPVALLVWGDPSLYDSTMRIAKRLNPAPQIRVIPGITAIQALTAAHAIPLNTVNGPVEITTGRRLRDHGWPQGADTVVVMLDAELSFRTLEMTGLYVWWGAYLGSPQQVLRRGFASELAHELASLRETEREKNGWIMDTYLLRRSKTP